jgi:stage V sporulation protein B
MPGSFIIPINTSVLPAITACLTLGDHKGVRDTEESAARITGLLAAPCAVGLAVLATPVMGLLGGYEGEKLALAGEIMTALGVAVFLYCLVMFTNVLLQSHGKAHIPVITTLVCGVAKLIAMYFLTGNPALGILAVPVCSVGCYLGIVILNLIAIGTVVPQKPALFTNLMRALIPAGIMGIAVYFTHWAMVNFAGITSNLLLCGIPIVVGVVIYLAGVVVTKTITRADCLLLPKGEQIADLLKL